MVSESMKKELHDYLDRLPVADQERVVGFARALTQASTSDTRPHRGVSGESLVHNLSSISPLSDEDAAVMLKAIEEGCEQIIPDDWK